MDKIHFSPKGRLLHSGKLLDCRDPRVDLEETSFGGLKPIYMEQDVDCVRRSVFLRTLGPFRRVSVPPVPHPSPFATCIKSSGSIWRKE